MKSFEDILNEMIESEIISYDIETHGDSDDSLNRHGDTSGMSGVALGWTKDGENINGEYIDFIHNENKKLVQTDINNFANKMNYFFEKSDMPIVGHNIGFDAPWSWSEGVEIPKRRMIDTMLASHLINSNKSNSLKDCVKRELNYEMSEISTASFDLLPEDFRKYAKDDGIYTLKLWKKQLEKLKENDLFDYYKKVIKPMIPAWLELSYYGINLDRDGLREMKSKITDYQQALLNKRYDYSKVPNNFNFNSPKQLGELFFGEQSPDDNEHEDQLTIDDRQGGLGLPTDEIQKTDTGNWSTDKDTLKHLKGYHPIVKDILNFKIAGKLENTFVSNYLEQSSDTGRLYVSWKPHGTHSGRFSSSPNVQNVPTHPEVDKNLQDVPTLSKKDLNIRQHFVAPEGKKLIVADYSQLELRIMADYSNEPTLVNPYKEGRDVHKESACAMFDMDYDEVPDKGGKRFISKTANYSLQYLAKIWRFSQELDKTWDEVTEIYDKWWDTKPYVIEWDKKVLGIMKERDPCYVTTKMGRPRYFNKELKQKDIGKSIYNLESKTAKRAYRLGHYNYLNEGISHIIQGTGADIMNLALGNLSKLLEGTSGKIVNQIHDEAVIEVNEDESEDLMPEVKREMERPADQIGMDIPLVTEPECVNKWSSAK